MPPKFTLKTARTLKRKLTYLALLACAVVPLLPGQDNLLWIQGNIHGYQKGSFSTYTHGESRFREGEGYYYSRSSQKLFLSLNPQWQLGLHPVYERVRVGDNWRDRYRIDLEVDSTHKLNDLLNLSTRHRVDIQWREEDYSDPRTRIWNRIMLTRRSDLLPKMRSYSTSVELIYRTTSPSLLDIRYEPMALNFVLTEQSSMRFAYLAQSLYSPGTERWNFNNVLLISGTLRF